MFINLWKAKTGTRFLRELIGYVDLTVSHEIWSEHSLIDVEQIRVGEFLFFLNIFLVAAINAIGYANFSIVQLDRSIKR